ncbi:MAG: ribosomal-processing cysteine protease Prp [Lachnospiraceae bacterium]
MIHITIYQNAESKCIGFRSEGHAEYEEQGQDIVCAAVSVLVINTINSIETFTDDKFVINSAESGFLDFRISGVPSPEASLLLNSMNLGLTEMEQDENYSDYIDIIFEEV